MRTYWHELPQDVPAAKYKCISLSFPKMFLLKLSLQMVDLLDEKNLHDIMVLFRASVSQTAEKRIFPQGPALNGNIQLVWMVLGQQNMGLL